MTSLRTQSNSETACVVGVHVITRMFAFHFLVLYTHLILMTPGALNVFVCFSQEVHATQYDLRKLGGFWRGGIQSRIVSDVK